MIPPALSFSFGRMCVLCCATATYPMADEEAERWSTIYCGGRHYHRCPACTDAGRTFPKALRR